MRFQSRRLWLREAGPPALPDIGKPKSAIFPAFLHSLFPIARLLLVPKIQPAEPRDIDCEGYPDFRTIQFVDHPDTHLQTIDTQKLGKRHFRLATELTNFLTSTNELIHCSLIKWKNHSNQFWTL